MAYFVADQDGNGGLTYNEYEIIKNATTRMLEVPKHQQGQMFVFALIDADDSGSIDASEMKRLVQYWGRSGDMANCRAHVQYLDKDGDGRVDFKE